MRTTKLPNQKKPTVPQPLFETDEIIRLKLDLKQAEDNNQTLQHQFDEMKSLYLMIQKENASIQIQNELLLNEVEQLRIVNERE